MNTIKTHAGYLIVIAVAAVIGCFTFQSWKVEHDQNIINQFKAQAAEANVKHLQADIEQLKSDRDATISALKAKALAVKTAPDAIREIPNVSNLPLNVRPAPESPSAVIVDAVPLYQELNQCRQDSVALGACTAISAKKDEQLKEKDNELVALKAKPPLRKRIWNEMKHGTFWVGVGITIAKVVL
jgi:outer membrane murein-binding lipoprotein Lpp